MKSLDATLRASGRLALARRIIRTSEIGLILLATLVGVGAGLAAAVIGRLARVMQVTLFGLEDTVRLSSLTEIAPVRLIALPLGGLLVGLVLHLTRRSRAAVDVVEANALHGGRIPGRDTLLVTVLTLVSNGCGASVGLEAAYAQAGGGAASTLGQWLRLRRSDLRVLVGAGAGGAIAAAFGAPLTGAFYAFEIVIGSYTPAAIAPIAVAAIAATVTARTLGTTPYLIVASGGHTILTAHYFLFAAFGIVAAIVGIAIMRAVSIAEGLARASRLPDWLRPAAGGLLLMPLGWISPQVLSAGHGALHLTLESEVSLQLLATIFLLKTLASIVSLGSGFRGGLFFASLLLGSLLGQIFAITWTAFPSTLPVNQSDAALVGMAALAVAIVGGPMTMALLVLEATHDFAITATVLTAVLCSSAVVRDRFGYSFSTWRLHLRGEVVRSARDIGWMRQLTAGRMMRQAPPSAPADLPVAEFRSRFPLGSTSRVVLLDSAGRYAGLVTTSAAFDPAIDATMSVASLAQLVRHVLRPEDTIDAIMTRFDEAEADDLAVVDEQGHPVGILTEKYVRRRYAGEADRALREAYGED
ncbi:MAG TPA: chloride channel protein [Novosphingobium sp.]|nr:chloride channel protein [Novosphingobium sp.]